MKRRLIRWLLRLLGYEATHFDCPELFVVSNGLTVDHVTTDRTRAIRQFERITKGVLVRYIPAERMLLK